jgi:hypothetical protein
MKHFFFLQVLIVMMAMSLFGKNNILVQTASATDVTIAGFTMTAKTGWDIYKAGSYRYGPSFIKNDDGSMDAWFAASGSSFQQDVIDMSDPLYNTSTTHSAVLIKPVKTVSQKFVAGKSFFSIDICCPTWGRNGVDYITLNLYQWNSTYSKTINGTPVSSYRFTAMKDNQWIELRCNNNDSTAPEAYFPAGTYVWTMSNPSDSVGVWLRAKSAGTHSDISYIGSSPASGCFESAIIYDAHQLVTGIYWDQISYQHSPDGGKTWSAEKMVLKPTYGSEDQFSNCDPGVAKWGGYYYIGYTSTQNPNGVDNNAYVARSKSPTGPWEKWNGTGWGGNKVAPAVKYTGNAANFGVGEPCFVIKNKNVYFYYSWNDGSPTTRLSVAPADSANWPALLKSYGTAINKGSISGSDHCDVKYCDSLKKFIAVHTASRMTANSKIYVWYSSDGYHFTNAGTLQGPLQPYLHNCGITGDSIGHIDMMKQQYIGYSYGPNWGVWNTFLNPLQFAKDGVPVGIQSATIDEVPAQNSRVFSLDGRNLGTSVKLSQLPSGIYIINRKKIFIP